MPKLERGDALVVVDVQRDFCSGGALEVPGGDEVVPVLNRWIEAAQQAGVPVVLSRDWHPQHHPSFQSAGGPWPVHCLQDSEGAQFHPDLTVPESAYVVTKGVRFDKDQNSAFEDTGLAKKLAGLGVKRLFVGGLAEDVCVLSTVLDGLKEGFDVHVIATGTRPVETEEGDRARDEMLDHGAFIEGRE